MTRVALWILRLAGWKAVRLVRTWRETFDGPLHVAILTRSWEPCRCEGCEQNGTL